MEAWINDGRRRYALETSVPGVLYGVTSTPVRPNVWAPRSEKALQSWRSCTRSWRSARDTSFSRGSALLCRRVLEGTALCNGAVPEHATGVNSIDAVIPTSRNEADHQQPCHEHCPFGGLGGTGAMCRDILRRFELSTV